MEANITQDNDFAITGVQKLLLSFALCLVAFMFVLDYTIANVAVPYIAGGLGVSSTEGTYVITFFAVGNAIFLPMTAHLVKVFGDVKVIIGATLLFTFFSFTCAASPNLDFLVVSRFLQGAAAGPLIPLSQSMLTKMYRKYVQKIATVFSLIVMIAPVVGPVVGGYICFNYLWRWIFYINLPIGIVSAFIIFFYTRKYKFTSENVGFDWFTFALLLIGMTCLQLFLDKGQQWDWWNSYRVRALSIVAALSICYIIIWSFIYQKPLFNLFLLKKRMFAISCLLVFIAYSLYFAAVVIFPLWLIETLGYTAFKAGLAISPLGLGSLCGALIVGRLMKYLQAAIFIALGFFAMAIACFYAANFVPAISFFHVAASRVIFGFGLSFWMVPIISISSSTLEDHELASGLGLFHFLRSLSGGIGTSIYGALYTRRGYHQQENIAYNFNGYKQVCINYYQDILELIPNSDSANQYLGNVVDSQAATFAFCEVNNLMGYICLMMMFLAIFAIQKKSKSLV